VQSGLLGALTGGGNVKIGIVVNTSSTDPGIVPMDHYPSWKLHKNPFWRVKHRQGGAKNQQPQQPTMDQSSSMMQNSQLQNPGMMQNSQFQQPGMMQQPGMPYQQGMMQPGMPMQQQQQQHGMMSPMMPMTDDGMQSAVVVFEATRDIAGMVRLVIPPGKKMEHLGIKVQFIGRIDMVCMYPCMYV
jgi:Vacuolar protein sorting-associated protein 26